MNPIAIMFYKQPVSPAHTITVKRNHARYREEYLEWVSGIPDGYIARFIEEGLCPFLKKYGYAVSYSPKDLIQACKEWAFSHVQIRRKGPDLYDRFFMKCAHDGGEDELDWYTHSIPFDSWEALASKWAAPGFLDDSDAGYAQTIDIAQFAWQLIDLYSSRTHLRWKDMIEYHDLDEDHGRVSYAQPAEDTGAYGGDRRTL